MIKLIIFDLDGTLADTGQDIADALNYALEPFGVRHYSVEETKSMVGSGISKLLESLVPPDAEVPRDFSGGDGSIMPSEIVIARFLDFYSRHLLDNTKAYPHVRETLPGLGAYRKAVLSNKRAQYSREILEGLQIASYFDLIWGSDSVREKKPSPVPVIDLIGEFGVAKEETVIVGDSNFDVQAGKAAGVPVVAVTYGFRSVDQLQGADYIINRFDELPRILSSHEARTG